MEQQQTLERQAIVGAINGDIRAFSNAFEQMIDRQIVQKMKDVRTETIVDLGFKLKSDINKDQ